MTLGTCRGQYEEGRKPIKGRAWILNVRPPCLPFGICAMSQLLPKRTYQPRSHPDNSDTDRFVGRTLKIRGVINP